MKNKFKILYVSSEVSPFAGYGNLSEVAGVLPKYLKNLGHDIRVMMPNYKSINERKYVLRDVIRLKGLKIDIAGNTMQANGKSAFLPNSKVQIYFLDNKEFFQRDGLYGINAHSMFEDNADRFLFFAIGCLETLKLLYWQPDIIHCNDWQTALIPALLQKRYKDDAFFENTQTVFSLFSIPEGSKISAASAKEAGIAKLLPEEVGDDNFDFAACGLKHADIVTVSDGLALEVNSGTKKPVSVAIGIDGQIWDAENSKSVKHHFSDADLSGKNKNKSALQEQAGLPVDNSKPVVAVIPSWLSDKALQAVVEISDKITAGGAQLLFVGQGEKKIQSVIDKMVAASKKTAAVEKRASQSVIQNAIAGADILLLPNESGTGNNTGQLCALRYGTLPVVEHSVIPEKLKANEALLQIKKLSADNVLSIVVKSIENYKKTSEWQQRVHSAMKIDFSWDIAIDGYIESYQKVAAKKK
jgi:starch synthase